MQNFKYHILNTIAVMLFSYTSAITINQVIKYNIAPVSTIPKIVSKKSIKKKNRTKPFDYYEKIVESGFFKIATPEDTISDIKVASSRPSISSMTSLTLIGTITGPSSIARALIKKQGEKNPKIYALRKINSDIGSDVFGYKLSRIFTSKVYLKRENEKYILELYKKKDLKKKGKKTSSSNNNPGYIKKTISRSEFKQKVLNNMDNAMRGLVAGPYRINGQIMGFRLKKVRSYNILYKLGARSGDIIKRINGTKINSTQRLIKLWDRLKNDSNIKVDLERQGKPLTFDLKISN